MNKFNNNNNKSALNLSSSLSSSSTPNNTFDYFANARKKHEKVKVSYFDDDDDNDEDEFNVESKSSLNPISTNQKTVDDDDYDPLDAFMLGVNEQVIEEKKTIGQTTLLPEIVSGIDSVDYDSYLINDDENDNIYISDDDTEYDQDGLVVGKKRSLGDSKLRVEPLAKVDHSLITYLPFNKQFYKEHKDLSSISIDDINTLREELEIHIISSENVPCPIKSFIHSGFDNLLLNEIVKVGYDKPTPIQSQALPVILSGRDIIGLAKTGSGKTLAFLWPMIVHILDQPQMKLGDGPIGLVLAPTRELASQILVEAKKFAKLYNIRVVGMIGGTGKWELIKQLKESPEIIIATPGRFIDLCGKKVTNLSRCTMVVLDEADRMFEMGFEYQMRSIVNNIRPDRQTLLFSATMKKKVEGFAREMLSNPIRIVVGTIGMANPDIKQLVEMVNNDADKWSWLSSRADEFVAEGKVLIFVLSKKGVEEIALSLQNYFKSRQLDIGVECLHGDKLQSERTSVMKKFSKSNSNTTILVATDVAARGLDVKDIRTVINYDVANNIETYVHRIGRTGRMGIDGIVPGTAYTLVTPKDGSFAVDLVQNLSLSGQIVPIPLQQLAEMDPKWSSYKNRNNTSKSNNYINNSNNNNNNNKGKISAGLGSSTAPKAMTSEMMANESKRKGQGGNISITTSSFNKILGNNNNNNNIETNRVQNQTHILFNQNQFEYSNTNQPPQPPPMKGFVRSSQAAKEFIPYNNPPQHLPDGGIVQNYAPTPPFPVKKKSRWDN